MSFNLDDYVSKYNVHPETIALIKSTPDDELNNVEAKVRRFRTESSNLVGTVNFDGSETEIVVPSPFDKDGIPITVYKPSQCDGLTAPTILAFAHGGGNVVGSRQSHATVCKILARDSLCIVVNIEYRLAPKYKFPANQDDINCVVEWLANHKTDVGGAAESKLGICGDSAGGKLAGMACHELPGLLQFAILVYPSVFKPTPYPSQEEFQYDPFLSKDVRHWFFSRCMTEEDKLSPRASIILQKEFSHLPPTLIIVAELDPLRDGCFDYFETLKKHGVEVQLKTVTGVPHGFFNWPAAFRETSREAHQVTADFIRNQS